MAGGGLIWVANKGDGTVTVIDPDADRVQQTLPRTGSGPTGPGGPGLAFASGSLWVANTAEQEVARVEPDADPTTIPVHASPSAIAPAPDDDAVWVAARTRSGGGLVARIDAAANQVTRRIQLRHAPTGLTVSPDGRTVWAAIPARRPSGASTPAPAAG